jgi:prepilin-type processing-associated H-X9-DG protein
MRENEGEALANINHPATTIMVLETRDSGGPADFYWSGSMANSNQTFQGHLGTTNFLFTDGHVKALKPTATGRSVNMWTVSNSNTNTGSPVPATGGWMEALGVADGLLNR